MSWTAARDELLDVLRTVDELDALLVAPPEAISEARVGVTGFLLPPARASVRRAGPVTERRYSQRLIVRAAAGDRPEPAMLAVDAAVEAIDTEMERHVILGGKVTSIGPFSWGESYAVQWPPETGVFFVGMDATTEIVIVVNVDRSP